MDGVGGGRRRRTVEQVVLLDVPIYILSVIRLVFVVGVDVPLDPMVVRYRDVHGCRLCVYGHRECVMMHPNVRQATRSHGVRGARFIIRHRGGYWYVTNG